MSGHWVFGREGGPYVGTRQNHGRMYESRTVLAEHLQDARVFNTQGAAANAGNRVMDGEPIEVDIRIA